MAIWVAVPQEVVKMKRISSLLIVFVMLVTFIPTTAFANTGGNETIVELIAGQHIDAGVVKVWNDSGNLYVKYITAQDWCLDETHLQVASSLDDIPQANGNPIPGQFEYQNTKSCVPNFTYTIPLKGDSCDLYIAAHAVVKKVKSGYYSDDKSYGSSSTETAWGDGLDFPGEDWATYFTYSVEGCVIPNPALSLTMTADPSTYSTVDQLISYSYVVENTGNVDLTGPFSVTDEKTSVSCEQPADNTLSPGETMNCSASYSITPADLDAGSITNTATVSGTDPNNNVVTDEASLTVNAVSTCQPTVITADFSQVPVGVSVEGLGVVAPFLNIDAKGTAIKVLPDTLPWVFKGTINGVEVRNGGMMASGGFGDKVTQSLHEAQFYTFTFNGTSVSDFSLRMLDYGDVNPTLSTSHYVSMTAYDANGQIVSTQELSYTTPAEQVPSSSDLYGDLMITGDGYTALPGQPGNWTWDVSGTGMVRVVLEFGAGFDPNIGFDSLSFICSP